jgi:hypothetical protein
MAPDANSAVSANAATLSQNSLVCHPGLGAALVRPNHPYFWPDVPFGQNLPSNSVASLAANVSRDAHPLTLRRRARPGARRARPRPRRAELGCRRSLSREATRPSSFFSFAVTLLLLEQATRAILAAFIWLRYSRSNEHASRNQLKHGRVAANWDAKVAVRGCRFRLTLTWREAARWRQSRSPSCRPRLTLAWHEAVRTQDPGSL